MERDPFAELGGAPQDPFAELATAPAADPFAELGPPSGGDIDLTQDAPQAVVRPPLPSARLRRLRDRLKADPNADPAQIERIQRMLVQYTKAEAGEEPPPESLVTQFGSAGAQAGLLPIAGLSRVFSTKAARVVPGIAVQQFVADKVFGKEALRRFSDEVMNVIRVLEPVVDPGRPAASGLAQAGGAVVGAFSTGIPTYKGGLGLTDAGWEAAKRIAPNLSTKAVTRVAQLAARAEASLAPRLSAEAARRAGNLVTNLPREFVAGQITTALTSPEEFNTWQGAALASALNLLGGLDSGVRPVAGTRAPLGTGAPALAGDARAAAVSGGAVLKDADILSASPTEIAGFAKAAAKTEVQTLRSMFGSKGAKLYRKYQRAAVSDKSTPEQAVAALEGIRRMEGKLSDAERQTLGELGKTGYTAKRLRRTAKIVAGYDKETLEKIATVDLVRQFGELLMTKKPEKNINTTYRLKKIADTLTLRGVANSELIGSAIKYMLESGVKSADAGKTVADAVARIGIESNRIAAGVPQARIDELRNSPVGAYARKIVESNQANSVHLVGSSVAGPGKDVDILYDLTDRVQLDPNPATAVEQLTDFIESTMTHSDMSGTYDSFFKVGDRYFHLSWGAGPELVENTAYAQAQLGKLTVELAGPRAAAEVPEPPVSKPSVTSRVTALLTPEARQMEARIKELEAKLLETEQQRDIAQREAETDPITGAGNARALERAAVEADKDPGWKYVLFDVAGLGSFNNALGQGAGDALMQFVVRQMQTAGENMGVPARVFRGAAKSDELYVIMKANTADEARFYRDLVEELVGVREGRVGDATARAAITGEVGETLGEVKSKGVEDALTRRKALFKYANDLPITKPDETKSLAQMITENEDIPQRITVRSINTTPTEPVSSLRNPVEAAMEGKLTDPGDALEVTPRTDILPSHSKHIQERIEVDPKVDEERMGPVEALNKLYTRLVRKLHPIEQAEKQILATKDVPAHQSAAAAAQLLSGTAGRVEQMLNFKPFRITPEGNIEFLPVKPLSKILEPFKGRLNEYRRYLVARRTLELAERGIDVGVDVSAAQMEVAQAAPEIKQAAMETTQFNNATLQYWVDAGGLSQSTAEALKLINRSYVSFRRAFGTEGGKTSVADKLRYAALSTPQQIREIVGSKLKILDPIFTTVDNTRRIMRAADLNRVGKQLVEMAEMFPDRALDLLVRVKDVEAESSPDLIADAGALMRAAKEAGVTLHKEVATELAATISDKALLVEGDVMRVWRNGKMEQWKVSPELGHALRSLGPQDINLIFRLLGLPSQFVKVGITSNPIFAAIQAFAGTFHAAIQSKYGFRPGIDSWIGFLNSVRNSQYRQEFLAAGGAFSQLGASEFRTTEAAARTVLPKTTLEKIRTVALHPIEALRLVNAPLEEAARIGVFIRARKSGASALEAALEARRVDTDFSIIGSRMAAFAHIVAFLNPFIQGTDTAIRAAAKNPKKVMLVGMAGVTLPSIYFWMAGEGDQEVRDLQKSQTGALNWVVRLPNGQIALLRKPYVYGQIFGNTAEEALNTLYENDPNAYGRMIKALRDQVTFNLEPNVFQMYRGMKDNRDPLTGNPIFPEGLEAAEPFLQSNYATSAFSQKLGETLNLSPAMLDFAVRQLGGTIMYDALKASDAILDTDGVSPPSPVPSDWPLMGRLLARYPSQSVEPVRSYYEDAEEVLKVMTTLRELEKQNRGEEFVRYASEHAVILGLAPVYAQTREELSKLRLAMAQVRSLPDNVMDRDHKRETVDYLTRQIIEVSRQINLATRTAKAQAQAQKTASAR